MPCSASFTLRVLAEIDTIPAAITGDDSDVVVTEVDIGTEESPRKRAYYTFDFLYDVGKPAAHAFDAEWTVTPTGTEPTSTFTPPAPRGVAGVMQMGSVTGQTTVSATRSFSCQVWLRQV